MADDESDNDRLESIIKIEPEEFQETFQNERPQQSADESLRSKANM